MLDQYAAEVTAGDFDLGAEAQAFLADTDASTANGPAAEGAPMAEEGPAADASTGGGPAGAEGMPDAGADGGQSRVMSALRTAGSAMAEGARWAAPAVGTALKEETGVDLYRFAGEQPELNKDQNFAAGVTRWAIRRAVEHMAERQGAKA